jgi:cytochrome c556
MKLFTPGRCAAALACCLAVTSSVAQTPPNAAQQAVAARKAVYTLIGQNFGPIGAVLQGRAPYDPADMRKRAERVAFLADLASEAFPDISNVGAPESKAKANIWKQRADFDQHMKEFREQSAALVQVVRTEPTASDAFRKAASALAQSCKGCHDKYREK